MVKSKLPDVLKDTLYWAQTFALDLSVIPSKWKNKYVSQLR